MQEVGAKRGEARMAGVLLHGRGIGAEGKVDLAARIGYLDGIRWIVPGGDVGSWYPNRFWDPIEANEPFLTEAVALCEEAVEEASENGRLAPSRLAIAGFSQGACLALEYALRHPGRVGTVIVFTGGLMGPAGSHPRVGLRKQSDSEHLAGLRALITGSAADDWIPEESTREAARVLAKLGADVAVHVYPDRLHVVNDDEVGHARALLEAMLRD